MTEFKKWFPYYKKTGSQYKLICFGHAGSCAGTYHKLFSDLNAEIFAVQLPLRENRYDDNSYYDPKSIGNDTFDQLRAILSEDNVKYGLFGHSVGTWSLYHFLLNIIKNDIKLPSNVFVSSFPHPSTDFDLIPWIKQYN